MYCPNCHAPMSETDTRCKNCGYMPVIDAEVVNEEVHDEPIRKTINKGMETMENQEGLKTIFKVLLILMVIIFPIFGSLVGIFIATHFMNDPYSYEKRAFGRTLLTVSIIVLILGILFCCISKAFGLLSYLLFGIF